MQKIFLIILVLFSCKLTAQKPVAKSTRPTIEQSELKLRNALDTMQYTIGVYVAKWINTNGFAISNPGLLIKGMDDVLGNKSLLVADTLISPLINAYQQLYKKEKASILEQQLFASLKDKPGIGMFPNGVRYTILKVGKGPRPYEKDSISLHLTAKLPDGTVVEDTYKTNKPFAATPTSFFPGLNETLLEMGEGAKWTLYIPSVLAYGEKGTTLIPPNSALILEVELLEVRPLKK